MNSLGDLARVTTATTGTGTLTLGAPVAGYLTFAQAGIADGTVVSYGIADGANSETGSGTYSGGTLTRSVYRSTGAGNTAPIALSGAAQVFVTALSADLLSLAPLTDPVLQGNPRSVTPPLADNDTSIATTAWVNGQGYVAKAGATMSGPLDISVSGASATLRLHNSSSGATATDGFLAESAAGVVNLWNYEATPIVLATSGVEAMRIGPDSYVGIGLPNPLYKLHIRWQAAAGGVAAAIQSGPNGADSTSYMMLFGDYSTAVIVGAITRTGTNSVAYGTASDRRLKDDITVSNRGLDALMAIRVSDYAMGETRQQGLLAQDVASVYPEAVHIGGDDPQLEPWLLDYGRLTPLLIKAVQDLAAEVAALKTGAQAEAS